MQTVNVIRGQKVISTSKDFDIFVKHCEHYRKILHINDWDIAYKMTDLENCEAQAKINSVVRKVLICLNKEREGIQGLKYCARHECLEVLLADIRFFLCAFYSDGLIDDEIHKVINKLMEVIK